MDFLAIDKQPKANWEDVLPQITSTLNNESSYNQEPQPDEHYGEVRAEVLMFKGYLINLRLQQIKMNNVNNYQKFISIKC